MTREKVKCMRCGAESTTTSAYWHCRNRGCYSAPFMWVSTGQVDTRQAGKQRRWNNNGLFMAHEPSSHERVMK